MAYYRFDMERNEKKRKKNLSVTPFEQGPSDLKSDALSTELRRKKVDAAEI